MGFIEEIETMSREKRELAARLELFDSNVWLGPPAGFPLAAEMSLNQLREALGEHLIRGALYSHWAGLQVSAQAGNQALLDTLESVDGLQAIWTGLPLFPPEQGPLPGFGRPHPSLVGVRLFPRSHNFPLAAWMLGELIEWLIRHHLPLFLWHVEFGWPALRELAVAFPKLTIVVETQTQKILYHNRPLFALMRQCSNILVETSNLAGADFVTYSVQHMGSERLLFGTFLPVNDPWAAIGMVLDADISIEEKMRIAGGNLRRILEGIAR